MSIDHRLAKELTGSQTKGHPMAEQSNKDQDVFNAKWREWLATPYLHSEQTVSGLAKHFFDAGMEHARSQLIIERVVTTQGDTHDHD